VAGALGAIGARAPTGPHPGRRSARIPAARVPWPAGLSLGRGGALRPVLGDLYRGAPDVVRPVSCRFVHLAPLCPRCRPGARASGVLLIVLLGRGQHGWPLPVRQRPPPGLARRLSFALMYVGAGAMLVMWVAVDQRAGARRLRPGVRRPSTAAFVAIAPSLGRRLFRRPRGSARSSARSIAAWPSAPCSARRSRATPSISFGSYTGGQWWPVAALCLVSLRRHIDGAGSRRTGWRAGNRGRDAVRQGARAIQGSASRIRLLETPGAD